MKRKLLWVAVMFALGEVTYIFADGVIQISIIFIMLICCVKKFEKISLKEKILLLLMFSLSILNIYLKDNENIVKNTLYDGQLGYSIKEERDDYYIGCYPKTEKRSYFMTGKILVTDKMENGQGHNYVVQFLYMQGEIGKTACTSKAIIYSATEKLVLGGEYFFMGEVCLFESEKNPGGFDAFTYYKANDIDFYLKNYSLEIDDTVKNVPLFYRYKSILLDIGKRLGDKLEEFVSPENVGVYKSILLGDKNALSKDLKSLYRINGIAHVLAISGLHISLVGGMIYKLFRKLSIGFLASGSMAIFIVVSYGIMTGGSNSAIRAVVMLALSIVGEILGRNYDMLTGMSLAFIVLMLINPYKLYDGGVILSFMACVGVAVGQYICSIIFSKGKMKKLKKKKRYIFKLINLFVISISVNLITIPVIISLYYEISLYSVFVNIIVIPLFTPVVCLGIVALIVSFFDVSLAKLIIIPGENIIHFYEKICNVFIKLPHCSVNTGKINIVHILLYYGLILLLLYIIKPDLQRKIREQIYRKTGKWLENKILRGLIFGTYIVLLIVMFLFCFFWNKESRNEIVCFLDVGQGDGILIRSQDGINIMIDGGSSSEKDVGEYVVMPALKYMGMAEVDYWFVTHVDLDHVSGLIYILEMGESSGIKVKNIVFSKYIYEDELLYEVIRLAELNQVNIMYIDEGACFVGKDFKMKAMFPDRNFEAEDKNQASLVLEYTSECMSMLFTGDIDTFVCEKVYEMCIEENITSYDVLKVPHHGSKKSISTNLYSLFTRKYAVISCADNNMYGHPHEETLKAINDEEVNILMTKRYGAIIFGGY